MTVVIPAGWKYVGYDYNNKSNSYVTESEADSEAIILRHIYPKNDFTSILDDNNNRWIIIFK